jgi:hypothetical protein
MSKAAMPSVEQRELYMLKEGLGHCKSIQGEQQAIRKAPEAVNTAA